MFSHHKNPTLALQALDLTVRFQHNMDVQPRLVPGDNRLWLEAEALDKGAELSAEWVYQVDGKQRRTRLELGKSGRANEQVSLAIDSPSRVRMTGLRFECG